MSWYSLTLLIYLKEREDKPKTLETGSGSGTKIPDTEGFPKPRIDEYLENRGIKDTKEQYRDIKDT